MMRPTIRREWLTGGVAPEGPADGDALRGSPRVARRNHCIRGSADGWPRCSREGKMICFSLGGASLGADRLSSRLGQVTAVLRLASASGLRLSHYIIYLQKTKKLKNKKQHDGFDCSAPRPSRDREFFCRRGRRRQERAERPDGQLQSVCRRFGS